MAHFHRTAARSSGFGFRLQMQRADYAAFRRWYDARCLLRAARAGRTGAFRRTAFERTPALRARAA